MSMSRIRSHSVAVLVVVAAACQEPTRPDSSSPGASGARASAKAPAKPVVVDKQPPTPPTFSITDLGPTHVTLAWSSTDNSDAALYYVISQDGVQQPGTSATSGTFVPLQPSRTYAFTAKARDKAGNWSVLSAPFNVSTPAGDPTDVTPPTTPGPVAIALFDDGSRELNLSWGGSTDNVTATRYIRYDVYLNGTFAQSLVGMTQTIAIYGESGENTITVFAFDEAGNKSAAATATITIPF